MRQTQTTAMSDDLRRGLGVRRATRLARVARNAQLPPEALLDLALELLEALNRHLLPNEQPVVGLAVGRWQMASPEERSQAMRQVAQARWGGKKSERNER